MKFLRMIENTTCWHTKALHYGFILWYVVGTYLNILTHELTQIQTHMCMCMHMCMHMLYVHVCHTHILCVHVSAASQGTVEERPL